MVVRLGCFAASSAMERLPGPPTALIQTLIRRRLFALVHFANETVQNARNRLCSVELSQVDILQGLAPRQPDGHIDCIRRALRPFERAEAVTAILVHVLTGEVKSSDRTKFDALTIPMGTSRV
jgi:hypothetical protein